MAKEDCTIVLFSNMPWKQHWLWKLWGTSLPWLDRAHLHPKRLTMIPESHCIWELPKKPGYLSLGWALRLQKSLKYQEATLHQLEHKQVCPGGSREPWLKGGPSSPTQTVEKHVTSLARDILCGLAEPARTSPLTRPRHLTCVLQDYAFPL